MRQPINLAAVALFAAGLLIGPTVRAQNPNADQIIKSLTPGGSSGLTRGIRIGPSAGSPATPATPTSAGTAAAPRQGQAAASTSTPTSTAPSVSLTVQFANGSAELTPQAVQALTELGHALSSQSLAAYRFRIEGHTDTVGGPSYNKALSDRRAAAVVAFLSSNFHLDPARLQPIGMGEDGLLVPTPPQTPEPRNRRVQVVNIGS